MSNSSNFKDVDSENGCSCLIGQIIIITVLTVPMALICILWAAVLANYIVPESYIIYNYQKTSAIIKNTTITRDSGCNKCLNEFHITLKYTIVAKTLNTTEILLCSDVQHNNIPLCTELKDVYRVGTSMDIYYDRNNPNKTTLNVSYTLSTLVGFIFLTIIMAPLLVSWVISVSIIIIIDFVYCVASI